MLDSQINISSWDTGDFYSNHEARLHNLNHKVRSERKKLLSEQHTILNSLRVRGLTKNDVESLVSGNLNLSEFTEDVKELCVRYVELNSYIDIKSKVAKRTKDKLLTLIANKVDANQQSHGSHHIRELKDHDLTEKNIISVFNSSFIRMLGVSQNEFTDDFLVVQVYYFNILKDLILYGFVYKGEKYRFYTASGGQIRTKKTVFVKESVWNKYEKTIMCGLTIDAINQKGGNNPNKHLVYMALSNSATDLWEDFDIDRSIVVDDFETDVYGTYDLISDEDYSIHRKTGYVPITHTDGAGMILPGAFGEKQKNRMVRLPWVKGLLGVFDFKKFIKQNNCSSVIKDIYGKEYDIVSDDIQVVFTKSQFKMCKYYDSWDEYKAYYKKYGCTAGYANIESGNIKNATINYQMLQTLTDITDSEIKDIASSSVSKIESLCDSVDNMKRAFGITAYNKNKTYLQKCIDLYPNLMNDRYLKRRLKEIKDSMVKRYRAGHLEVMGKYTFILPDFYAACEFWFMNLKDPDGLLKDKEVFCNLFKNSEKLDCLRSPHLYKEHAVRYNMAYNFASNASDSERKVHKQIHEWFCTNALYTSCHDLISKLLMFDVDGDTSLVVADKKIIDVAERNMKGIVPLYYNMRKAEPKILTNNVIYDGLISAFTSGNIGRYSNMITQIWNSDAFIKGTPEEQRNAIDCIKLLCMENNFCIDSAKTLYMPVRPQWFSDRLSCYTKNKLPCFFTFAKDKSESQVEKRNGSFVNKLYDIIPNPRISCKKLGLEKIDYKLLMNNKNMKVNVDFSSHGRVDKDNTEALILKYLELSKKYTYKINQKLINNDTHIPMPVALNAQTRMEFLTNKWTNEIVSELKSIEPNKSIVTDKLVKFLYGMNKSFHVELLWLCYGEQIYKNLKKNLSCSHSEKSKTRTKSLQCRDCGQWFSVNIMNGKTQRCKQCQSDFNRFRKRKWKK